MTKPLSMDIRDRAMARLDAGETVRDVADALSVAPSSVVIPTAFAVDSLMGIPKASELCLNAASGDGGRHGRDFDHAA